MPEYVTRRLGKPALDYLLAPALSATFDADAENMSAMFLLSVVRFVLGGFRLRCFDRGTGVLCETLAQGLNVEYGKEALGVEKNGQRFNVRTANGACYESEKVVVAVPGTRVLGIAKDLLSLDEVRFFQIVGYCEGIIVYLLLPSMPKHVPYYGLAFSPPEGIGLYGVAMDHYKPGCAPPGTGLLNGALTQAAAQKLFDQKDEKVVAFFLGELARTPVGRLEPFDTAVMRWRPMLPLFYRGYLTRLRDFERRKPTAGIEFAGDYLIGPYTEAALVSGLRAAERILQTGGS
jgi:oxygen-dependent protoporphyrinogen oxidase